MNKARPYPAKTLDDFGKQRTFTSEDNLQIAFPLGGLGAGMVCLNGYGGLQDFAIRNRPATSATPDGHGTSDAAFATLHIKGKTPVTKLIEGPMPVEKLYNLGTKGQGFREGGFEGLPRFERASFRGEFPMAYISLKDRQIPLDVTLTGFNPFIPLDDRNSSLPCAILEYTLTNRRTAKVDFDFSYHLSHLAPGLGGGRNSRNRLIPGGASLYNTEHPNAEGFGSASLTVIGQKPTTKGTWFRGGWFDNISALWREVSTGAFKANSGNETEELSGRNGGSIQLSGSLKKGESITYPILITWHFSNCHYTARRDENNKECGGQTRGDDNPRPPWRPFYAGLWRDAADVAAYVHENYASLKSRTGAFHQALFSSTVPAYVLDAVSANLGILKSPTFLRQENGNAWAWEGCFVDSGCCAGSCTHVWNYAQAFPHLFPNIERTFREQELERTMDRRGHVTFRSALPDGDVAHTFHPASDGQLGGVMKVYREWQISGDIAWLKKMYPLAKRSLDYCIKIWDPDHKGVLIEPHHNTYDIEFWGADGMCSSIYLGALAALAEMATDVGKPEAGQVYKDLGLKGAAYLDKHLFNGEYYFQKVQYRGLRETSFARHVAQVTRNSGEVDRLLKKEGPKYQYGTGCISDGVIGAWMAAIYQIPTAQNRTRVRRTLKAIFEYNFRHDLSDHACTQRPGYANGHEPGLLLCSWPRGGKPTLPFVYSDEVWTGIEC
ncbi:MAG: GH116 family glycosyl hydrolase, partial [bacterium]|nr:GH116 family glycosyl hydrolase [bacterium]